MSPGDAMPRLLVGDDALTIAALILDKDGTLHRFDRYWVPRVEARLAALSLRVDRPVDDLRRTFGLLTGGRVDPDGLLAQGTRPEALAVAAAWLHRHGLSWMAARASAVAAFADADAALSPETGLEPIAGLHDWLGRWADAGGLSAIASTAGRADVARAVAVLQLGRWIPWCLGGDEGVAVKPSPDAVFELCGRMGLQPGQVAVVGDGVNDMRMGRAAGVAAVIGVLSGVETAERLAEHADWVVPDLTYLRLD
jgi:phosphoglycolate phosphatase